MSGAAAALLLPRAPPRRVLARPCRGERLPHLRSLGRRARPRLGGQRLGLRARRGLVQPRGAPVHGRRPRLGRRRAGHGAIDASRRPPAGRRPTASGGPSSCRRCSLTRPSTTARDRRWGSTRRSGSACAGPTTGSAARAPSPPRWRRWPSIPTVAFKLHRRLSFAAGFDAVRAAVDFTNGLARSWSAATCGSAAAPGATGSTSRCSTARCRSACISRSPTAAAFVSLRRARRLQPDQPRLHPRAPGPAGNGHHHAS